MDLGDMYNLALGALVFGTGATFFYKGYRLTQDLEKQEKLEEPDKKTLQSDLIDDLASRIVVNLLEEERTRKFDRTLAKLLIDSTNVRQVGKPIRTAGRIDYHFQVGNKQYVHSEPDPDSNYLFKTDNNRKSIESSFERELVNQAWQKIRTA